MRLADVRTVREGGAVRLVGVIETSAGKRLPDVYFEYGREYGEFLREDADVFISMMLSGSMLAGEELSTDLPVSAKMAREMSNIQAIFSLWFPGKMNRIETRLPNLVDKAPNEVNAAGVFFSAGVDAYYSIMAEKEGLRRGFAPLTHLIYMVGLEAPLSFKKGDKEDCLARIAEDLGYPLIVGRTNLRDVFDYAYIPFVCGPALAGVGLSLSRGLSALRVPAGSSYRIEEVRAGSTHHLIDRLRSTEYMYMDRDGGEARRSDKVEFLAQYPLVLENLSVCTRNLGVWDNCGKCPKCVRTMIALQALGKLGDCPTLPSPFDYRLVRSLDLNSFVERYMLIANLELARRTGSDPKLVDEIERHIWRHDKYRALVALVEGTPLHPPLRCFVRFAKKRFADHRQD